LEQSAAAFFTTVGNSLALLGWVGINSHSSSLYHKKINAYQAQPEVHEHVQRDRHFAVESNLREQKAILLTLVVVQCRNPIDPKPVLEDQHCDEENEVQIRRQCAQVYERVSRWVPVWIASRDEAPEIDGPESEVWTEHEKKHYVYLHGLEGLVGGFNDERDEGCSNEYIGGEG
jgi:hypothetical protein